MEPFLADFINNPKVPKWLRHLIATLVCGLLIFIGVMVAVKSPMLVGKFFGGVLAGLSLIAAIYLFVKIAKSSR